MQPGLAILNVIGVAVGAARPSGLSARLAQVSHCHPGREVIAERLDMGVKRVTAALKKLCGGDSPFFTRSLRFNTSAVYTFVVAPEAFVSGRDAHRAGRVKPAPCVAESKGQNGPSQRVKTDRLTTLREQDPYQELVRRRQTTTRVRATVRCRCRRPGLST